MKLRDSLAPLGWIAEEPHYNGAGFRPHITVTIGAASRSGDSFTLDEVALVEMLDPSIVRACYRLERT